MSKPAATPAKDAPKGAQGKDVLSGEIGKKYKSLVQIMTKDPRYAKALADVTPPSQHEKLSDSLTNISFEIGASLAIIKALINLEFQRKHLHPFTILRVNSIVSKMIGKYSKKVGEEYLRKLLVNLVNDIYSRESEDWELEKERMTGDDIDKRVEENMVKVQDECQKFVDRITNFVMVDEMPRHLRAICYFMAANGEQYKLEYEKVILPLVSGFVMLRFICPAITVPNNYGVNPKMPQGNVRKNLTLVAKILQKIANGEKFEVESPHLMPLNAFIEKNQKKLNDWLALLAKDPEQQEGRMPFGDLQKSVSYEDIHFKTFDKKDLQFLHQMIYEYGYDMIVTLQTEVLLTHEKRPVSLVSTETEFLALIQELGPTEPVEKPAEDPKKPVGRKPSGSFSLQKDPKKPDADAKKPAEEGKADGVAKKRENLKGKTFEEIESQILERSMDHLMKNLELFDLSEFEQARFLYVGKPTKNNLPVVYLVLSRLNTHFLLKNDPLMVFVFKTLQAVFQQKYVVVVDLSWADIDDEMQAALYRAVVMFVRLVKQDFLLNCHQIYTLHPNFKTQQGIEDVMNIMSADTRKSLVKVAYDWMDLSEVIEPSKIWIPFVSKKFTPMTYHVFKAGEGKDKKAERYLKISHDSILNIDAKSCTVQGEILFDKIVDVKTRAGSNEVHITYKTETENDRAARGAQYLSKPAKDGSQKTKKYTCYTEQQRDIILEAIFEAAVRASSLNIRQAFIVQKENKKNKFQKWLIKLTTDSILNFKDKVIKSEVPYSTIQSFYLDEKDKTKMLINFVLRGKKKCYVLAYDRADEMRDALLDAIKRFKFSVQIEKDLLYKKEADTVMDKLFFKVKDRADADEKQWSAVMPIEQPRNDLKKLFKKFNPKTGQAPATVENITAVAITKYKLPFSEDHIKHIIKTLDKDEKGFFILDDLIKSWIYVRREKQMIQKRVEALKRKPAPAPAAAKK